MYDGTGNFFFSFDGTVSTCLHSLVVETAGEENQALIPVFKHISATNLGHCLVMSRQTGTESHFSFSVWDDHYLWVYLSISDDAFLVHQSFQCYQHSERSSVSLKMFCLSLLSGVDGGLTHLLAPSVFNILLSSWLDFVIKFYTLHIHKKYLTFKWGYLLSLTGTLFFLCSKFDFWACVNVSLCNSYKWTVGPHGFCLFCGLQIAPLIVPLCYISQCQTAWNTAEGCSWLVAQFAVN